MKHYTKAELTTGYCPACETHVDDLVIEKKICTGCLDIQDIPVDLEEEDGEDNDW